MPSTSGRSTRSTFTLTTSRFITAATSGSSKLSCAMTWHQWHDEYPTERSTGLSSARAFSNASSPHGYQSTGLSACWRRYGLVSPARRFISLLSPSQAPALRDGRQSRRHRVEGIGLARGARTEPLGGGGFGPPVVR